MPVTKKKQRLPITEPFKPFSERGSQLMTLNEAADYLSVKPRAVLRLVGDDKLRMRKIGNRRRFHIDDLKAVIEGES